MARIRTVKPGFWKHEELSALPEATHMLAAALLNYADDYGYFNANPRLIQAECSPLREPSVSIPESLRSLQNIGYVRFGTADDGKRYGQIITFSEHQKVSHPTESKISKLSIVWEQIVKSPEPFQKTPEPLRPEGNKEGNKERKTETEAAPRAAAPPVDVSIDQNRGDGNPESISDPPLFLLRPDDFKKALYGPGLAYLSSVLKKPQDKLRSIIGLWLKDTGNDAERVFKLLADAELKQVADPRGWVAAAIARSSSDDAAYEAAEAEIYRGLAK